MQYTYALIDNNFFFFLSFFYFLEFFLLILWFSLFISLCFIFFLCHLHLLTPILCLSFIFVRHICFLSTFIYFYYLRSNFPWLFLEMSKITLNFFHFRKSLLPLARLPLSLPPSPYPLSFSLSLPISLCRYPSSSLFLPISLNRFLYSSLIFPRMLSFTHFPLPHHLTEITFYSSVYPQKLNNCG